MLLHVDDFGCAPDGRVLERAAVEAGSAVLVDPDGTLRATDVGKHIAVPGAADLVASIVGLRERKDVINASMASGSSVLTAALPPEEGFRAALHTGLRCTVAGAGPGGGILVTDVAEVLDKTTLRLADAASSTVTNASAVLNRPDLVVLSDYARATAVDLTVDLVLQP